MDTTNALNAPALWMPAMDARSFEANGNEYFIQKSLSVDYMEHFERKEIEFGFGASFQVISSALVEVFQLLNKREEVSAGVLVRDLIKGIANLEERHTSAVELCTLFMLRKGEDTSKYDEKLAEEKIADWKAANIDVNFFFQHAALSVNGFIHAFRTNFQGGSKRSKKQDQNRRKRNQ
jgi:hypothetical protein